MISRSVVVKRSGTNAVWRAQARRNPVGRRFQSTVSSSSSSSGGSVATHMLAGLLGGGVVLGGVYAWYHTSGAKTALETARSLRSSVLQAKDKIVDSTPSPSEALSYLRQTASAYAIFIPGGKQYVDSTFDALEETRKTHGQEVDEIVSGAYKQLKEAIDKGGADVATAEKVGEILVRSGRELGGVARKASGDLLDKYPGAKEKLGGAYDDLQKFAQGKGEEGKKAMDDVKKQLADILKSGGSPDEMWKKAQDFLRSKQKDLQSAGGDAWQKALDSAKPALDKVPEIRQALEENKGKLMGVVSGAGGKELWDRVKKVADMSQKDRQKAVGELKGWISEQAGKAKDQAGDMGDEAWDKLEDFVKSLPGGSQILDSSPEFQKYTSALKEKAPEAQKLAEETVGDIMKVLKEKAEKMGKMGEDVKEQGKK